MSGTTLNTLDSILKTQYLGPIREQLNNATALLSRIERDDESVVGKNFTIPVHYGRNEGIGARAEGAALPLAGNQAYKEAIVPMKNMYGRFQVTGQTIKASKSNEGAFVRAVDSEMKGLVTDIKQAYNRMLWGDGTGILTLCGTTSNSTTVVVVSTKYLRVGMVIDILATSDGTSVASGVTITSIPSSTSIVISGSAITTSSSHAVYVAGSRNIEVMGLQGIVKDSGTLQGLDPSTYTFWKSNVLANGGTPRAISETLLQTMIDTAEMNNSQVTALYTSHGVRRAYQALLSALKQYTVPTELKGGYKVLDYNGLPLIADKDAPSGKIFGVNEDQIKLYRLSDFEWMQDDGAILSRVSGYDAYEAVLFSYCELGTSQRNAHVLLSDITEA